jgi:catechol 2,3-dioxygenase-like lactoylglutathione lyase family enzyme
MELAAVRIFVTELAATTRFYADAVGLELVDSSPEVALFGAPERQLWGGSLLHADDPSGNTITFVQVPSPSAA